MAYTGFPATYPQTYPQYYPQYQQAGTQMSSPQQNSGMIWIQGVESAKAFQVAPNSTVVLWDSEQQCCYIKSADASGMPSMRILDYTIRSEAPRTAQNALYGNNTDIPTRQDLNAMQGQIDALKEQIERLGGVERESALSANAATRKQRDSSKVSAVQTGVSR
jgi:hypothetical protein